tara:strand:+ start:4837 stop:6981 length:2145 start_codon:yes stop_codon:yes gene_type:complete
MAYGIKYELFFSDVEGKRLKIEILQKNFIVDPFGLGNLPTQIIGTDQPCVIEWDADDDIYSPIIGSRCILNFFVTDSTIYDDFYKADEREYKVKILEYTSYGSDYDAEELPWEGIDQNWDGKIGSAVFYNAIWEGFIVVDRYQEAVISNPYPISIEAIDGIGTLDSFDVPFTDSTSVTENLFYYLKEILKLTGHEYDILVANDTREVDGNTNDTIFHDIIINKYAVSNENLTLKNAKDVLEAILKATNSRIYQSNASWYIVNNSSLIDNRIAQSTEAPSPPDDPVEPDPPSPDPVHSAPNIVIVGEATMYALSPASLLIQNTGSEIVLYTWTLPNGSTDVQVPSTSPSDLFGIYHFSELALSQNGETYSVVATDANGNTDSDSFTLSVVANPDDATKGDTGEIPDGDEGSDEESDNQETYFEIILKQANSVQNAYFSPIKGTYNYAASQVGDSFTMTFDIVSSSGEFTSVSQLKSFSVTGGFTITAALIGEFIRLTVTGTLPTGGHIGTVSASGASDVQNFTHTYNTTDNLTNASRSPAQLIFTGGDGKSYSGNIIVTASANYQFEGKGDLQVTNSKNIGQILSVTKNSDTQLTLNVSGTIGVTDETVGITMTAIAQSAGVAASITVNPSGAIDVANNGGYFDASITSNGNFTITPGRNWITTNITNGTASTSSVRVYFTENNTTSDRVGRLNFYAAGTSTILASIRLSQEGTQ